MKKILIIFSLLLSIPSQAGIDNCLKDALTHGNHLHAVSPSVSCINILKGLSDKVEARGITGKEYAYGVSHMFYLERLENNKIELMAGDQTQLKKIVKIRIDDKRRRILVLQNENGTYALLTFDLDFVGNVGPMRRIRAKKFNYVNQFKLISDSEIVALSKKGKTVWFMNADADIRFKGGKFTPKLLREIKGAKTTLSSPLDATFSKDKKLVYILEPTRILVFTGNSTGDVAPEKVIPYSVPFFPESIEMSEDGENLILRSNKNETSQVKL